MQNVQSGLKNFGRALLHGIIVFVATTGGAWIAGVPVSIGSVTLISLLTGIVSWCQHAIATPSGSTVVSPPDQI